MGLALYLVAAFVHVFGRPGLRFRARADTFMRNRRSPSASDLLADQRLAGRKQPAPFSSAVARPDSNQYSRGPCRTASSNDDNLLSKLNGRAHFTSSVRPSWASKDRCERTFIRANRRSMGNGVWRSVAVLPGPKCSRSSGGVRGAQECTVDGQYLQFAPGPVMPGPVRRCATAVWWPDCKDPARLTPTRVCWVKVPRSEKLKQFA